MSRGQVLTVELNGEVVYEGTDVHTLTFDGMGGFDEVDITGSDEYEKVVLTPHTAPPSPVTRSPSRQRILNEPWLRAAAGTISSRSTTPTAMIRLSVAQRRSASPGTGSAIGPTTSAKLRSTPGAGGLDTIDLRDSQDKDKAKVDTNDAVKLYNPSYYIRGKFFEEIVVTSNGGVDQFRGWDTPADDTVKASYEEVVINHRRGLRHQPPEGDCQRVRVCQCLLHRGRTGCADGERQPRRRTSWSLRSHKVTMFPRTDNVPYDYEVMGRSFDVVHAKSTAGGGDVVRMHDTPEVDLLEASYLDGKTFASLSKPVNANDMALMYDALGFDSVNAVNDYEDSPKNQKDVDDAVDFLMLDDAHWDDI